VAAFSYLQETGVPVFVPSLLKGQGGDFDFIFAHWKSKSPPSRKNCEKGGAPSRNLFSQNKAASFRWRLSMES